MTGERPYKDISNDMQVISHLMQGNKPRRPSKSTVNPSVWDLMECCWHTTPSARPKMELVLLRMEKFYEERKKRVMSQYC